MSDKYIIRNCPAIYGVFLNKCKKDHYEDGTVLCQDCTDCVIKQVIEKCKEHPFKDCACGDEILQLFDIEEVRE